MTIRLNLPIFFSEKIILKFLKIEEAINELIGNLIERNLYEVAQKIFESFYSKQIENIRDGQEQYFVETIYSRFQFIRDFNIEGSKESDNRDIPIWAMPSSCNSGIDF